MALSAALMLLIAIGVPADNTLFGFTGEVMRVPGNRYHVGDKRGLGCGGTVKVVKPQKYKETNNIAFNLA